MSLETTVEKYALTRDKIKELQKKLEKYKLSIERSLTADGLKKIRLDKYTVSKRQIKNERLNKTDCPKEIWEKYKKVSLYTSLEVEEVKKPEKSEKQEKAKARKSL